MAPVQTISNPNPLVLHPCASHFFRIGKGHGNHGDTSLAESRSQSQEPESQKILGKIPSTSSSTDEISSAPAASSGSGSWQAVHERASRQFFPDAQAAEEVFSVVEAFCRGDVRNIRTVCY